jgi:hypothetical protein
MPQTRTPTEDKTHADAGLPSGAAPRYAEHDPSDALHGGAQAIVQHEAAHLLAWRGRLPDAGLALSGGGIRSASYCLGVLQALAHERCLPNIDYLSTVSGGGYIGASLSYLLGEAARGVGDPAASTAASRGAAEHAEVTVSIKARVAADQGAGEVDARLSCALASSPRAAPPVFDVSPERFPYLSYPMVGVPPPDEDAASQQQSRQKGRLLRRLRQNANYLAPGNGITFLSLAGVLLRNLAASAVVHVASLVIVLQLLISSGLLLAAGPFQPGSGRWPWDALPERGYYLLLMALGLLALYVVLSAVYVVLTGFFVLMEQRQRRAASDGSPHAPQTSQTPTTPYHLRRLYDRWAHRLLALMLFVAVFGVVPWVYDLMVQFKLTSLGGWMELFKSDPKSKPALLGAVATVLGLLGNVWGLLQTRSANKPRIPTSLVITLASVLLTFGVLLLVFLVTGYLNTFVAKHSGHQGGLVLFGWMVASAAAVLALFGWWPNANYVSLHRFYRDRLMELFLPDMRKIQSSLDDVSEAGVVASPPGDAALLGNLCGVRAGVAAHEARTDEAPAHALLGVQGAQGSVLNGPYHLINANMVLVASKHPSYRGRGGDNCLLSPLYCGSRATGWKRTDATPGVGLTLATAMAISGAALSPNAAPGGQGYTRQPVLSVLMGMLNLRLGYWLRNPNPQADSPWWLRWLSRRQSAGLVSPGLFESFGRFNLHEHERYVLLTDGGHFENLALYELVRRRLKLILVCDATADPDFKFVDLANAIEKVRADFGAIVEITSNDLAALVPQAPKDKSARDSGMLAAERGYLIAPIRYSRREGQVGDADAERGCLIYLKATFFKELFADLHGYRRAHPTFPNQSTSDQFFNEKKFEAYRELGFQTAWLMLQDLRAKATVERDCPEVAAAAVLWR